MRVYRIAKAIHSTTGAEMMSGEGGLRGSARWHTKGRPIIYTATSQALATLEIAVNLKEPSIIPAYRILEVDVPDNLVVEIEASMLPTGWDRKDGEPLNPSHPEFSQVTYGAPLDFPFDPRIKA